MMPFQDQEPSANIRKRMLLAAFVVYVLLLLWAVVFKFSIAREICHSPVQTLWERFLHGFDFFPYLQQDYGWGSVKGVLVLILNFLLFIPFGIYVSFFCGVCKSILGAVLLSLSVELFQLFAGYGVFSVEDVIVNVLGACLGVLLFYVAVTKISTREINLINRCVVWLGGSVAVGGYLGICFLFPLFFY